MTIVILFRVRKIIMKSGVMSQFMYFFFIENIQKIETKISSLVRILNKRKLN